MLTLPRGTYSGNILRAKSGGGVTACITQYNQEDYFDAMHCHENAHFSFMVQGGCIEEGKEARELVAGSVTYYTSGENHRVLKVAEASRRVNMEIDEKFFREHDVREEVTRLGAHKNPDAKLLMVKVYRELLLDEAISAPSIQMTLLELMNWAKKHNHQSADVRWARQIDEYLRSCPDERVSLPDLAKLADLHPVTLSKKFPQYFGCTLGEYKRKLKIEKSLHLVKSSTMSLTKIALECGFYDQNHFIRTFKALTGFLPLAYRKS